MKEIEDIVEESLKMKSFNNPNVLNLIGVCIDAGEAPYIVMPYMATGSLLNYLRKERPNLTIAWEASEDIVSEALGYSIFKLYIPPLLVTSLIFMPGHIEFFLVTCWAKNG